ncbi:MAG TPA: CHRD domain-containing protein, partial [Vicinamibacterales bacterium]|nr:CHRD domain-containing protein [Vicinamibacterales bacterium]
QIGGLVKAGVLPAPLDSGSVILAGYIHQGAAGTVGPPVVQLPISLQAPIVTPTGSVVLTISNVPVSASAAGAILANPSGFYFNLYSALNQNGVIRGQLVKQ